MLFQDASNTSLTPILHCESALALDLVFLSQASLKTCLLFGGEIVAALDLLLHVESHKMVGRTKDQDRESPSAGVTYSVEA